MRISARGNVAEIAVHDGDLRTLRSCGQRGLRARSRHSVIGTLHSSRLARGVLLAPFIGLCAGLASSFYGAAATGGPAPGVTHRSVPVETTAVTLPKDTASLPQAPTHDAPTDYIEGGHGFLNGRNCPSQAYLLREKRITVYRCWRSS
jgi:hypothetical protein